MKVIIDKYLNCHNAGYNLPAEQESCVFGEGAKDEQDAGQHPGLDGSQTLSLGGVGCYCVENVDQNKEEGDQQSHSS